MRAATNGIEIEYETFGSEKDPPVLLVMGFSQQLVAWEVPFCAGLAARGFRMIRFDHRDVGLSTKMASAPPRTSRRSSGGTCRPCPTGSKTWPTTRQASSARSGSRRPTSSASRWAV